MGGLSLPNVGGLPASRSSFSNCGKISKRHGIGPQASARRQVSAAAAYPPSISRTRASTCNSSNSRPGSARVPRTGSREPCRVHCDGTSGCTSIDFGASTSPALIAVIASSERPSLRKLARQLLKRWQEWRPPRYRAVAIFYRELGEERFRVVGEGRRRANRRRTPGLAHGH